MTLLQLLQRDGDGTAWLPAVRIDDATAIATSFPSFTKLMTGLGAEFHDDDKR